MSKLFSEKTYFVTYRADDQLAGVSTIRSITLAATTTDIEDARVLTLSDLVEEFGVEVATHFVFVDATVKV